MKISQTIMKKRLEQVEQTINEYLDNPTVDPTTLASRESQLLTLKNKLKEQKEWNATIMLRYLQAMRTLRY